MAKPTEKQIRDLEKAHKILFYSLVQANNLILNAGKLDKSRWANPVFLKYIKDTERLIQKWQTRQSRLEVAGIPPFHPIWFNYANQQKLNDMVKSIDMDKGMNGIGFIPLIIWGIIAIAGLFTAEQIVDETTTTTQEQAELIDKTRNVCKDMNLSPEDCKKLITTSVQSTGGGGMGIMAILGLTAAFILVQQSGILKEKPAPAKAA